MARTGDRAERIRSGPRRPRGILRSRRRRGRLLRRDKSRQMACRSLWTRATCTRPRWRPRRGDQRRRPLHLHRARELPLVSPRRARPRREDGDADLARARLKPKRALSYNPLAMTALSPLYAIVVACLAGGVLAILAAAGTLALHARWISKLVSFAVGALLGAVFLELLPHALEHGSTGSVMATVLGGLLLLFPLEERVLRRPSPLAAE